MPLFIELFEFLLVVIVLFCIFCMFILFYIIIKSLFAEEWFYKNLHQSVDSFLIFILTDRKVFEMLPFDHKEALKGKLCKTNNGMYVLIKTDTNEDARINPKPVKPLIGVVFDNESSCIAGYWDYDGKSYLNTDNLNIAGILEESELDIFDNSKVLKEAFDNNKKVTWENCPFANPVKVEGYTNDVFTLSFDGWITTTTGKDMKNLRIVD